MLIQNLRNYVKRKHREHVVLPVPGNAWFSFSYSLKVNVFLLEGDTGKFCGVKKSIKQKQMVSEARKEVSAQRSIGINVLIRGVKDMWETSNKNKT